MSDNFKIDFNVPWVVRLYTIWKPIYENNDGEYNLKYIEFLVFIHSVIDSNGNEINEKNIEYIEVVTSENKNKFGDFTIKIPEVSFEEGNGGKDIKKFRMNNTTSENYDANVWNLNNNLNNKVNCEYKQYYTYANFVDDLYGINGEMSYDDYYQKSKKRKNAYENSLLFKIHLKNLPIDINYKYDKNTDRYKESSNDNSARNKVVYAVASNPFFLPAVLFDERSNNNEVYSFFNTDEFNIMKAFICSHDVNAHSDPDYKINNTDEFNCFYKKYRNGSYANYNYVYAIKSLYSSGNIKLEICSPFEWSDDEFNIYSRYQNTFFKGEYSDSTSIKFDDLYGNSEFPEGFNVMSQDAKQIVCYHNGIDDNYSSNNKYYLVRSDYDTSYIVNDKSILIDKELFKKKFCKGNSDEYNPNKYIDCGQRKSDINFGTATWAARRYNTLAKLTYEKPFPPFDDTKVTGVGETYNNNWFFNGVSDVHTPCILFYGMYKVESIL